MGRFRKKRGITLVEMLLATLLISVVFMAVSALYIASQRFCLTANDKVIILYELQYAADHVYKNVMTGIGDKNNPAISVALGNLEFSVRHIEETDPAQSPTYSDYTDDTNLRYKIEDNALLFDGNDDGDFEESLVSKITVVSDESSFSLSGDTLTISLTGQYNNQKLTVYSACYPRLASFN
ncbi:MAG: prepilin-type N-terminal cleavage/methylation domain-containing protein [Candidatus Omnitrophica bacterium]|nr:prepilin-type N-terminal cleavage/methylation domain-containing protein [Candidatus Omnitrophota bacterium]